MEGGHHNLEMLQRPRTRTGDEAPLRDRLDQLIVGLERLRVRLERHERYVAGRLDDIASSRAARSTTSDHSCRHDVAPPPELERAAAGAAALADALDPSIVPFDASRRSGRRTIVALCLRPFSLFVDATPVKRWNGKRSKAIFRLLLTRHPVPVERDVLIDTFWPDADPDAARRSLHQAMYRLRAALRDVSDGDEIVSHRLGAYGLREDIEVWIDACEFERLVRAADRHLAAGDEATAVAVLEEAEYLYADDYMADHPYDDWCRDRRTKLRRVYADVGMRLADIYAETDRPGAVISLCRRLLARDPTDEAAYRRLMQSYLATGHRHLAIAAFRECQDVLHRELDVVPDANTCRLFALATA